jgi:hypothetical protein
VIAKFGGRSIWGLVTILLAAPVNAQPPSPSGTESVTPVSTEAADLSTFVITPRAGAGYSSSGGGYDGFGSFNGFFPLRQTPGKDLMFLQGAFLVDNDGNPGGNVLLGYRRYDPTANRIFGGYLGYDNRNTGNNIFSQIGIGLEALGETWDVRANGYIPVGKNRQTIREQIFDTDLQVSDLTFQDHFLQVSGSQQQKILRDLEAALAGFDVESGGRLLRFANGGDLRGYAGLYYYDVPSGPNYLGFRARIEARPTNGLTLGVAVQHDGLFGTNVFATLGLTFPGIRPKGANPESVLARMGESPYRNNAIVVDQRQELEEIQNEFTIKATNPETGQPYFFQHVTLGASPGDGTFERPFGQVQPALSATRSDGNDIVYVQAGSNPGIPAFTIPNRVQVLSTGPRQFINASLQGQALPALQLPLSGSGILPNVTGTVTMGSDTVLSGFNITSTTGAGVTFANVNRVEIRDNIIRNTADAGVLGNGAAVVNLLRNQITAARNQGVYIQNAGIATVTDNVVSNTLAGTTLVSNPITGDITLGPITIPNPGSIIPLPSGQGIVIATVNGQAEIARNTVSGTGTQGIVLLNATGPVRINDNAVANTVGADFTANVPPVGNLTLPTGQGLVVAGVNGNLEISRNTVTNVRGQGIAVAGIQNGSTTIANNTVRNTVDQGLVVGGTTGSITIANNQISDVATRNVTFVNPTGIGPAVLTLPTGQGLLLLNSTGTVNITSNTIERVQGAFSPTPPVPDSGQGIAIANFAGQIDLNLTNNQVRNNFNDGILIGLAGTTTPATANITISGNTLENNGGAVPAVRGDGIAIGLEQNAVVNNLLIENNIIRNNGDEGIDIRLGLQAIPIVNPTTARLTGTIRNNTIANNGQNGVQVQVRGSTVARVAIDNNTITNNGLRGVDLSTASLSGLGSPNLSANVRGNTITQGPTAPVVQAATTASPGVSQTLCLNLNGNTFTNFSNLQFANALNIPAHTFALVGTPVEVFFSNTYLAGGSGSFAGVFTNVAACP